MSIKTTIGTSFGSTVRIKEPTVWGRLKESVMCRDWGSLRTLGNSKIVQSNLLWVFLIPITAKVVLLIRNTADKLGPIGFVIRDIQLPFSWLVLFASSLAFSIGAIVFTLRCPKLVKEVGNFGEFESQGRSDMEMKDLFIESAGYRKEQTEFCGHLLSLQEFLEYVEGSKEGRPPVAQLSIQDLEDRIYRHVNVNKRPDAFAMLWNELCLHHPRSRWICSICYAVGFLFLAIIFLQNIWAVIRVALT